MEGRPISPPIPERLQSDRYLYTVTEHLPAGEICDMYRATAAVGTERHDVIVKIAGASHLNDFVHHEIDTIQYLRQRLGHIGAKPGVLRKSPEIFDTFTFQDREAVVLGYIEKYYTLEEIRGMYPSGIAPQHAAWIFNRTIEAIAAAHEAGVVHGAVLPCNMLIRSGDKDDPLRHTGTLVNWAYAVRQNEDKTWPRITAMSDEGEYRAFYPPEVEAREPATPATDIAMAAGCAIYLLGGDVARGEVPESTPWEMSVFLREYCRNRNPAARPQDVFTFHREFHDMLRRLFGPPQFYFLSLPPER